MVRFVVVMLVSSLWALAVTGSGRAAPPARPPTTSPQLPTMLPPPPPVPNLDFLPERMRDDGKRTIGVLPLEPKNESRGFALAEVLRAALTMAHDLNPEYLMDPLGFMGSSAVFASNAERAQFLASSAHVPPGLATVPVRLLVGGEIRAAPAAGGPSVVFLWLMDRTTGGLWWGQAPIDVPGLRAPRLLLLHLLADAGLAPRESERTDMLWIDDLDDQALDKLGSMIGSGAQPAWDAVAPWSFTATRFALERMGLVPPGEACSPERLTVFDRVLSLNPHARTSMGPLSCVVEGFDFDGSHRGATSNCQVSMKALASVTSLRDTGMAGLVAGLGGLYQGETCGQASDALEELALKSKDTLVRAGLLLELGLAKHLAGKDDEARVLFAKVRDEVDREGPTAPCPVRLLAAEAVLRLADLALTRGDNAGAAALVPGVIARAQACGDLVMEGRARNSRGLAAQGAGQLGQALGLFGEALKVFKAIDDEMNVAVAETNLGATQLDLGRPDRALPHFARALAGKRRVRSDGGVAMLLGNVAVAEMLLRKLDDAETHLAEALALTNDAAARAGLEIQITHLHLLRGNAVAARRWMDAARADAVSAHARVLDAVIEQVEGSIHIKQGEFVAALRDLHAGLAVRREIGDRAGEGITLSLLMTVATKMDQRALAILYGKLAVEAHQAIRASAGTVDADTERAFVASRSDTYRALADLLVTEGRLVEAEQVMQLVKEEEVREWTRAGKTADVAIPLTPAEKELEAKYSQVADKVMGIGLAYAALSSKPKRTPKEDGELKALRENLAVANKRLASFLASLEKADTQLSARQQVEAIREGTGIGADLAEIGPDIAAVYALVTKDAYHAIIVTKDATVAETVAIGESKLNSEIALLRAALQDPRSNPLPPARALWKTLVEPIAKHLDQAHIKTVIWSLDGALRYLPMHALHDGQRYLLERWASAVFTPASRARLKDVPRAKWTVQAFGVTQAFPGFPALPAVAAELAAVVDDAATPEIEGVLEGDKALDGAFTKDAFLTALERRAPVVHIASHFEFTPGDKDASSLLLGDGSKLSTAEIESLPNVFQGVDLLALSACNTAVGDVASAPGREVESFAVLAQRKGARAVLATLWPVADRSTSALIQRFYALHRAKDGAPVSKLEALRIAQRELLSGTLKGDAKEDQRGGFRPLTPGTNGSNGATEPGASPLAAAGDWRHPYYWAPFVLVGNFQ